jgi:phosphatidylglycerophosphate synthase
MTALALRQLLLLLMSVGFLFALFGKAVGLPEWTETAGAIFGGLCAISGFVMQRRAKKYGGQSVDATPEQRTQRRRLFIVMVAIATLSSPLWLPVTGVTLPLPQLVVTALVSCVFAVAAVLIATRDGQPKV